MKLSDFNNQYRYKPDKQKCRFIEVWDIPELHEDGKYYGDCEDYCIFLKHNIEKFEDWDYYYCNFEGFGHCVLMKDNLIIDCNCKCILDIKDYLNIYNVTNFKKFNKFTIMCKFIMGKIIKLIKGV